MFHHTQMQLHSLFSGTMRIVQEKQKSLEHLYKGTGVLLLIMSIRQIFNSLETQLIWRGWGIAINPTSHQMIVLIITIQ